MGKVDHRFPVNVLNEYCQPEFGSEDSCFEEQHFKGGDTRSYAHGAHPHHKMGYSGQPSEVVPAAMVRPHGMCRAVLFGGAVWGLQHSRVTAAWCWAWAGMSRLQARPRSASTGLFQHHYQCPTLQQDHIQCLTLLL